MTNRPTAKVKSQSDQTMFCLKIVASKLVLDVVDLETVSEIASMKDLATGEEFGKDSAREHELVKKDLTLLHWTGAYFNTVDVFIKNKTNQVWPLALVSPLDIYVVHADDVLIRVHKPCSLGAFASWYFQQAIIVHRWVDVWGLNRKTATKAKKTAKDDSESSEESDSDSSSDESDTSEDLTSLKSFEAKDDDSSSNGDPSSSDSGEESSSSEDEEEDPFGD